MKCRIYSFSLHYMFVLCSANIYLYLNGGLFLYSFELGAKSTLIAVKQCEKWYRAEQWTSRKAPRAQCARIIEMELPKRKTSIVIIKYAQEINFSANAITCFTRKHGRDDIEKWLHAHVFNYTNVYI